MPSLSREQLNFLDAHNIPVSMVFDATGLRRKDWESQMRELGLRFAHGTRPCRSGNHTLKTKAGCIQCNPAFIAFANRYYENGFVYLAYSAEKKLIKVGVGRAVEGRENSLNRLGYAGASDWKMLHSVKVDGAGQIEFSIHSDLAIHNVTETYLRDGNQVVCREVFRCDMQTALLAFEKNTGKKCAEIQEILHRFPEGWSKDKENPHWFSEDRSEDEDALPVPGDENGKNEWGNRFRRLQKNSDENKSENTNNIYSLYAVSVPAIKKGVNIGFTTLDKSDLLRSFEERYPGYRVNVWHYVECSRYARNEEIVLSNTKHFKLLSDGFFEIQPLRYSISLCSKILDEIEEQGRNGLANAEDQEVITVREIFDEPNASASRNSAIKSSKKEINRVIHNGEEEELKHNKFCIYAFSKYHKPLVQFGVTSLDKDKLHEKLSIKLGGGKFYLWAYQEAAHAEEVLKLIREKCNSYDEENDDFFRIEPAAYSITIVKNAIIRVEESMQNASPSSNS